MAKSIKLRNPITKEPFYPITLIKNVYSNDGTQTLLNGLYPVGSIYISTNSKSPADIFGGSWERIQDRFLLGAGSSYSAGSTGGEATHTLTENEIPNHEHREQMITTDGNPNPLVSPNGGGSVAGGAQPSKTAWKSDSARFVYTQRTGGGQAHNNMPPYLVVFMWKRVS